MNTVFKVLCVVSLLASCAAVEKPAETAAEVKLSLTDRVQAEVVKVQQLAAEMLPPEIAGLKSVEPVANREQNQRGAGFVRTYADDDVMATVFVYNNQEFGVPAEMTPEMEALMDKHLSELLALQDSGLYSDVKTGTKKTRSFRWKRVDYQVLEADASFTQRDEAKKSFFVLGANKDLMSFVRIRFTYPKSKQSEASKKQSVFTRTVLTSLNDFAVAQKTPVAE